MFQLSSCDALRARRPAATPRRQREKQNEGVMRRRGTEERRRIAAQLNRHPRSMLAVANDGSSASQGHAVSAVYRPRSPRLAVLHRCVSPASQTSPLRRDTVSPSRLRSPQRCCTPEATRTSATRGGETGEVSHGATVQCERTAYTRVSLDVSTEAVHSRPLDRGIDAKLRGTTKRLGLLDSDELRLLRHRLKAASYGGVPSAGLVGQRPQSLLRQYDLTSRGALSHDEFRKLVRMGGRLAPNQISDATILRIFRVVDASNSGLVSLRDLTQLVWGDDSTTADSTTVDAGSIDVSKSADEETGGQSRVDAKPDGDLANGDGVDSGGRQMLSELASLRNALSVAERERDEAVATAAAAVEIGSRTTAQSQQLEKWLVAARRDGRDQCSKRVLHSALLAWRLTIVSRSRAAAEARCTTLESKFAEAERLQQAHASSVAADLRKTQASEAAAIATARCFEQQIKRLEQERAALYADQEGACHAALVSQRQLSAGRALAVRTASKHPVTGICASHASRYWRLLLSWRVLIDCVCCLGQLRVACNICTAQHWMLLSVVLQTWARRTQSLLIKASSQGWRNPNGRIGIQGRTLFRWHATVERRARDRNRADRKIVISLLRLQLNMTRTCFGEWYRSAQTSRQQGPSPVATPARCSDGSPIPKGDTSIADLLDRSLDQPWLRSGTTGIIVSSDDESSDSSS